MGLIAGFLMPLIQGIPLVLMSPFEWVKSPAMLFRAIDSYDPLTLTDRAALGLTAALTVLACAATVVPLYALARATLPAPAAWSAAVLWPLVPSTILFQPLPDTAYPLLATTALALAAHAANRRSWAPIDDGASDLVTPSVQWADWGERP